MDVNKLDEKLSKVMEEFESGMWHALRNAESNEKTVEDIKRAAQVTEEALNGFRTSIIEYLKEK